MRKLGFLLSVFFLVLQAAAQDPGWHITEGKIQTPWAGNVNPENVLNEYPRPQMQRDGWMNLNGLWEYAIVPLSTAGMPVKFDGRILVPFAVESALSGVSKTVGKDSVLWYRQVVNITQKTKGMKVLLHFGAVDWQTEVYVNGVKAGTHTGGYSPFDFDITALLKKGSGQEITVRVWDPSNDGPQPRGKQVKNPRGIWYTPVTGIWQTVWLELVPETYISGLVITPDLDKRTVSVQAGIENFNPVTDQLIISAWKGGEKIAEQVTRPGQPAGLEIKDPELWSPVHPFLYDLTATVSRKGKKTDKVKSYFAMRKISMGKGKDGIQRMLLNNEFVFQYGPLDQGWWPDGLYTAPTDEALKYDIAETKEMGFNMIRKHVKVEPARWYYHCDKLGMLVWQDMPSGDMGNRWESRPGVYGKATDKDRSPESETIYKSEWKAIMESLHNFPSIVVWVPFNEAWGQFKTKEIVNWTMQKDPSRLVNTASGGNFVDVGHIIDLHNYPEPLMPDPDLFGADRVLVLGEFGGLGLPLEGHTWQDKNNWGYQSFKSPEELIEKYSEFIHTIPFLIKKGLSAAVYTQTTDVEIETNGLMTYDRKVIKMPVEKLKQLHLLLTTFRLQ